MVTGTLHREEGRWILVLPDDEIDKLGLQEGQELEVTVSERKRDYGLDPDIETIASRIIRDHREAQDHLAE